MKQNLDVIARAVIPLVELIGLVFVRHLVVPHLSGLISIVTSYDVTLKSSFRTISSLLFFIEILVGKSMIIC